MCGLMFVLWLVIGFSLAFDRRDGKTRNRTQKGSKPNWRLPLIG